MKLHNTLFLLCILCCLTGCQRYLKGLNGSAATPTIPGAYYTGTDSCIPCHDDIYRQYKKTIHYRISSREVPSAERGCETCHGPGSLHVKSRGAVTDILSFSRMTPAESSELCLQCHTGAPTMDWRANVHVLNGVGCSECHKSHKVTAPKMVYLGDPELCYTCHQEKKAQNALPSHHPVREGKMKCTSCHTTHGSENNNLHKDTLNDLCLECHAEYQGPYVYEHAPAVEDCSLCHEPHGTIANSLLVQNEPFLCLRCHKGHQTNPKTGPQPTTAALLTSCTQCHSQVHGSDLPAQLPPGKALTR